MLTTFAGQRVALYFGERSEYKLLLEAMLGATMHLERPGASAAEKQHAAKCLACLATLTCLPSEVPRHALESTRHEAPRELGRDAGGPLTPWRGGGRSPVAGRAR